MPGTFDIQVPMYDGEELVYAGVCLAGLPDSSGAGGRYGVEIYGMPSDAMLTKRQTRALIRALVAALDEVDEG